LFVLPNRDAINVVYSALNIDPVIARLHQSKDNYPICYSVVQNRNCCFRMSE